jgi:two-component system, chemotaxis family, chemotaxis protein CheY
MAHILIVDDEDSIRELIKEVLAMDGHTFDMAADGSQALEKIRAKPFDLVIMDRNMPTMTGIQALAILRAHPKFKELKVLMCTSASVTKEIDEAFEAGATDYILKPINLQMLLGKVTKHIAKA